MKVCYLSSTLTIHDFRFLRKLCQSGVDVTLVSYTPKDIPPTIAGIEGLKIIHRRPNHFLRWQKYFFLLKRNDFRRILRRVRPDLVHSGYVWKDGFLGALSGFTPHLLMPWGSDVLIQPDQSFICRQIVRYTLRRADKIYCDAEAVKNKVVNLSNINPQKVVVFPQLGIDLSLFKPDHQVRQEARAELGLMGKKVLIMTRNLEEVYGVKYFIRALPDVIKAEPDVRVLIAGTGPQEYFLRELVVQLGMSKYVEFLGYVENSALPRYLNASDVYVSSSLSDGTSLSLLEAMSCGLPVIVTDVDSIVEWVKDGVNGRVVPRGNSQVLAETIVETLSNVGLAKVMGERNLQIARQRADLEKNFAKLMGLYQELIDISKV